MSHAFSSPAGSRGHARRPADRFVASVVSVVIIASGSLALAAAPACSGHYTPRGPGVYPMMKRGSLVYVRDGQEFERGFFGGGLIEAVSPNPRARAAAETARSRVIQGLLWLLGGTACMTISLVAAIPDPADETSDPNEAALGLGLACAVATFGSVFFLVDAEAHRLDAINIYNDSLLQRPTGPPGWDMSPSGFSPPPGAETRRATAAGASR